MNETSIVWFRNDLRLNDHEPLTRAIESKTQRLLCVYCVDPRQFGTTRLRGFPRTGVHRARFLIESLADLRQNLRRLGNDLAIRIGRPEEQLPELAEKLGASGIYFYEEATDEELQVEKRLTQRLKTMGVSVNAYWGSTLFHRDDLPFEVRNLPQVFTQFRIRCEKDAKVRPPLSAPKQFPPGPEGLDFGELPTPAEPRLTEPSDDPRAVLRFQGGETAALDRIEAYIWRNDRLRIYKQTRNGLLGADYSSKFSPWLSLGCVSPRTIAAEVARYENARVRNDSTYWLVFELMWRDYFRFLAIQAGTSLFSQSGPARVRKSWSTDSDALNRWIEGRTGIPFVDANMRELKATGFMSNRGRQNVASFLAKDLEVDWRFGAEWFESQLIDDDVCSNWGNWAYVAGVGTDPRQDRRFNVIKQAYDYDTQGEYVRTWLPELASLSGSSVHEPWKVRQGASLPLDFGPGFVPDYPPPMIDMERTASTTRSGSKSVPNSRKRMR